MARYRATVETPQTPEQAFSYLSDFTSAAQWDPGVVAATRVGDQPIGKGAEFHLVAEYLGRRSEIDYRIIEFDAPRVVTLYGENRTVTSRDRITFTPTPAGTAVEYDADLRLKGAMRIADPLLRLAFKRVGDRACAGLRRALNQAGPDTISAAA